MADPVLPDGCYEQPQLTRENQSGTETGTRVFKGGFGDLVTFANGFTIGGSVFPGTTSVRLRSVKLERTVGNSTDGNLGTLTMTYGEIDQGTGSGGSNATKTGTKWSMKHTQKMISIYRYCGDSDAGSANRGRIEQWRKGTDAYLYHNFQWRDKVGAIHTLTGKDQQLAGKFRAGFDSVMRFYPTIQCVETFTKGKITGIGLNLATIVDASAIADSSGDGPPSGWTGAAAKWLKIGDDLTFDDGTGVQTRTQSWLGEEDFDVNFYGTGNDRWAWGSV